MAAGSDVAVTDDGRITYKDMYGNAQSFTRTHDCDFDKRDVMQMYAAAFRYAVDKDDDGEARKLYNENTHYFHKQSFDDYDTLVRHDVAPEVLAKVADNMALLIARQTQHTADIGNQTAEAILADIADELKQPPPWEADSKGEDIYCR